MYAWNKIRTSAPGNLMVMGEHAVLHGQWALGAAVDKRIHLELQPRADRQVIIHSALAEYHSDLDQLEDHPNLSFVLKVITLMQPQSGFELTIVSEFSHTVGLGSSAAVTVALVAALMAWHAGHASLDRRILLATAHETVLAVQGRGSGTDLATSVHGGLIAYRMAQREVIPLPGLWPIALVYAGYKTPTPVVIRHIAAAAEAAPALYDSLYQLMGDCAEQAMAALEASDLPGFARCLNMQHGLLDALGVCDASLADIVYRLRGMDGVLAAKISGSGLGDCILALGRVEPDLLPYEVIDVAMSDRGVEIEFVAC
ncbi:GHMP kinase [Pokkaliibacter plantistimulans]|nr:GHMP kinase [Pokkaliibacter plantistimulans]